MKRPTFIIFCFHLGLMTLTAQTDLRYLGQNPPSDTPQIFAPGIISRQNQSEFGSIFSANGSEFFFGVDINGKAEIRYSKLENNTWSTPMTIIGHESYSHNDPMLSPDQNQLYYISNRPKSGVDTGDYDIWYSERLPNGWSDPINAGENINSSKNEYYISFTSNGTMYYSSNKNAEQERQFDYDIYTSHKKEGEFQKSIRLGKQINTPNYEADVFISPDESYIVFCSTRQDGYGKGDLYISFKKENGEWTESVNLGTLVNTKNHELCPWVTDDGKYLFFTSNQDIYWVSTDILKQER